MTDSSETKKPKVFISYSHTSEEHKSWVRNLAEKLVDDGVDVLLDQWELRLGHDLNAFMERLVNDESITHVLMICDKEYVRKANERAKGVGSETLIISEQVYEDVRQSRFIAVAKERSEEDGFIMPTYYKGRILTDFTDDEFFDDSYEELLRELYDQPLHTKPKLGMMPTFLQTDAPEAFTTQPSSYETIKAIKNNEYHVISVCTEYAQSARESLLNYEIDQRMEKASIEEAVFEKLGQLIPARNDILSVLDIAARNASNSDNVSKIFRTLMESLLTICNPAKDSIHSSNEPFEHFRFLAYEIFLRSVIILIKRARFQVLHELLVHPYFVDGRKGDSLNKFTAFNFDFHTFLRRRQRTGSNRYSLVIDELLERNSPPAVNHSEIFQADLVLAIASHLPEPERPSETWRPRTLLRNSSRTEPYEIFARAVSARYFQNLRTIFGISDKEELEQPLERLQLYFPFQNNFSLFYIVSPKQLTGFDALATAP